MKCIETKCTQSSSLAKYRVKTMKGMQAFRGVWGNIEMILK